MMEIAASYFYDSVPATVDISLKEGEYHCWHEAKTAEAWRIQSMNWKAPPASNPHMIIDGKRVAVTHMSKFGGDVGGWCMLYLGVGIVPGGGE